MRRGFEVGQRVIVLSTALGEREEHLGTVISRDKGAWALGEDAYSVRIEEGSGTRTIRAPAWRLE